MLENHPTVEPKPYSLPLLVKALFFVLLSLLALVIKGTAQAPNNACGSAVQLISGPTCNPTAGTVVNASLGTPTPTACGGTVRYDVWYYFTAQSINPIIRLGSIGGNFNTPRVQVLTGNCTSMTQVTNGCNTAAALETTALNLTIGSTYYIRVYSTVNPIPTSNGSFTICVIDPPPPVNDEPTGAIVLTSNVGCTNTTANIGNATFSPGAAADCSTGGTPRYDVWYSFVAQRVNPAIRITGANAAFATPRTQIFSGTPGNLTSIGCGTATYTPTTLTIGETYYIRVYSSTGTGLPNTTTGAFNICIEDPARPGNDNCAGASLLTQNTTCSNTTGNLSAALPTTGVPGTCGSGAGPDVWYRFTAATAYPEITVSGVSAALMAAGVKLQVFSGTCGALVPILCNWTSGNRLAAGPTTTPFTVGQTYYVRVYTDETTITGNLAFSICVSNAATPDLHFGKTYANITKGNGGGTIEPGDILEIRAVLNLRSGTMFFPTFTDNIPANTTYVPGTLRILTNEGKIFRQWTDGVDSDPAHIVGSAVTIRLGNGANATSGGAIRTSDRPTTGSQGIMMISYRVQVNAVPFGTVLQMGGGAINYTSAATGAAVIAYSQLPATVYPNYGICTNTIGTNGILSEFGGTFGSGNTKDRAASAKVPANYTYAPFGTNAPGDYYYGVSNNTSANAGANYSTIFNDPDVTKRVFSIWDIIGDHTGATDPLMGNAPADVVGGASGGYMVVINAAYRADTAFQDTVRNLCPNTSYEYSAWFRNICRRCGIDSAGIGSTGTLGYIPTAPGDSSGVRPNLTFNINGSDYYSTGDILYTGQWVKKGFTYRTGPNETEMIINIRNNAPGGGGNDWAIDDIGVATCSPALILNPATPTVNVCYGDGQSVSAEVLSYYDNFTHYIWERSADSGTTWTPTGHAGTAAPTFNGSEYQYTAVGPSFIGDSSTHNNQYRLRVASSAANLADIDCSFRAVRTIIVRVNNCMWVLKTKLGAVSGTIRNTYGVIDWNTTNEEPGVEYIIEKSTDGSHYSAIGTVKGKAQPGFGERYQFTDPVPLTTPAYYRIRTVEHGQSDYSKVVLLSPYAIKFDVKNVLNPFANQVSFDVTAPAEGQVRISVMDNYGRVIRTLTQAVSSGLTTIRLNDQSALSSGIYGLKVEYGNSTIIKRIVKMNH